MKNRSLTTLSLILLGAFVLTGCPPKNKMAVEEKNLQDEAALDQTDENADAVAAGEGDIQITQDWTEIPALQTVTFGYDSATIDESARGVLKKNVSILKKLPKSVTIRVEGHTDDRGTIEYNIALGQRRANAVRSYYVTAGLDRNRLDTISFGEERPTCSQETDACWAQNRRSVTKVKNSQSIAIKSGDLQ